MKKQLSYVEKEIRTSHTKGWLFLQSPDMIYVMRRTYARELGCPLRETNENFESDQDLFWVYTNYKKDIEDTFIIH